LGGGDNLHVQIHLGGKNRIKYESANRIYGINRLPTKIVFYTFLTRPADQISLKSAMDSICCD
jgi:hypothetical protein